MATVEASVEVPAPLADVWDLYFGPDRWPSWVDQFAAVTLADGYPDAGGRLVWRSTGAGRGEVRERVLEHAPRSLHRIEFEDPESTGRLETRFEIVPAGDEPRTRVSQRLEYELSLRSSFGLLHGSGNLLAILLEVPFLPFALFLETSGFV
jgi:uncharacterized protein YndB with AHSA1/START domain